MADKSLYIHIGNHKTGTTSIQNALFKNKQTLADHGYSYFHKNHDAHQPDLPHLHSWLYFKTKSGIIPDGLKVYEPKKLAKLLADSGDRVIVSSENFSFLFNKNEINKLQKSLNTHFHSVKIICYIRRQDQQVISHHQEGSKTGRSVEYELYGHSTLSIPRYNTSHDLYLNYNNRLTMWADAFGDQNMIIRLFQPDDLKDGDAVADFFQILEIENYTAPTVLNSSLGYTASKIGHLINQSDTIHKKWLSDLIIPKLDSNDRLLPSKDQAREYYKHYIESNRLLNNRLSISKSEAIFNDDFSRYPETAQDRWTEQKANETFIQIMEIFESVYGGLSAEILRDAAVHLEKKDLNASYKLMYAAHKAFPKGPWIQEKLKQYEKRLNQNKP